MSKIITTVQMAKAVEYLHEFILQVIEDAVSTNDREPFLTSYGKGYMYSLPYDVFYKIATEEFDTITRDLLLKAWETINGEETTWITLEAAAQVFAEIPKEWKCVVDALNSENVKGREHLKYCPIENEVIIEKTYDMDALLAVVKNTINSGV